MTEKKSDSPRGAYPMEDAAHYIGISRRTLYVLIKSPDGPKTFTIGGRRLISKAELDAYIARREATAA